MKKIVCLLLTICCFLLLCVNSFAGSAWRFTWTNTTVYVPVGDSIEKYKDVPQAKLLKDGVVLGDTSITYNTEGDWLYYFKDINTQVVGEYKVWYKAYEAKYSPGTCTGYKSLISFIVEDKISPTIDIISDTVSVNRGSTLDLSNNYIAKDNYELEEVKILESVDTSKVGSYDVTVVAIDKSNNQTTKSFKVVVYENSAPVISCSLATNSISIPLNGEYDIKSIFTASDNVDGDITSKIVYPYLDTTRIGTYPYTVTVTNLGGVSVSYTISVAILDDVEPKLELNTHSVILDYNTDFESFNFKKYIKTLTDNVAIDEKNLSIENNLENKVGSYIITYTYTDGVYTVTDDVNVTLVSKEKPQIEVFDIEITQNDIIDIKDFITITDDSDDDILESVEINDSNVDYSKEGTYYAEVYCVNSSGLSATKKVKVIVKSSNKISTDNIPFIIVSASSCIIALGLAGFIVFYFVIKRKMK